MEFEAQDLRVRETWEHKGLIELNYSSMSLYWLMFDYKA